MKGNQKPDQHHHAARRSAGRHWYKDKKKLGAAVAVGLIVAVGGIAHYMQNRQERAAFLMTPPDMIPGNAELMSYAMPRGKAGYQQHCASCHGEDMKGHPFKGIPDLVDNDFLYGSGRVSEIERIIMYGIRSGNSKGWDLASMPAFGRENPYPRYKVVSLGPQELHDIVSYIYAFRHKPTTDAEKKSIARGGIIWRGYLKGVCWDCHANDAKGDTAIGAPNLTDNIWLYGDGSRQWIYDSIAFGLHGYSPAFINRLPPETIRAIAVYLHSKLPKPATPKKKADLKTANAGATR